MPKKREKNEIITPKKKNHHAWKYNENLAIVSSIAAGFSSACSPLFTGSFMMIRIMMIIMMIMMIVIITIIMITHRLLAEPLVFGVHHAADLFYFSFFISSLKLPKS